MNKVVTNESDYWDNFYTKWDIDIPSQFCVLVATEADKARPFVEFGCGNGRDSIYLARHGFSVFSGDLSKEAIAHNTKKEGGEGNPNNRVNFHVCDVADAKDVMSLIEEARGEQGSLLTLYNRFFLHSIDDDQERMFLTTLSEATKTGDRLYMEFRCSLDADLDKVYGDHYRRYVETSKLVTLLKELNFDISYEITGQGMAKYKKEDPFVSRLIIDRN
jgi:tellurite methyltransferase